MKLKLILAAGAAAVLLITVQGFRGRTPGAPDPGHRLTARVTQNPMVITVKGAGAIQAVNPNKILPQIKRQATLTFLAPEGSQVQKGDVVARLNTDELDREISSRETTLIKAQTDAEAALTALEIQKMDNEVSVAKAQQELTAAELELEKFRLADEPVDTREAELAVQTAESDLSRAQDAYRDYQALFEEQFVTADDVEEKRIDLEKKKVQLETSRIKLTVLKQYGLPVRRAAAQGRMASAKAAHSKAIKECDMQLRSKTQNATMADMNLKRAQEDLQLLKDERAGYEIRAPVSGVLNYGDPDEWWRYRNIQVGGSVYPGRAFLNIPDMSSARAVVVILEADISKVKLGQKATIRSEAMPGRTFSGEVTKVPEVASRANWQEGNQFKVEIQITNGADLKTYSCEAEIVVDAVESAVQLPLPAIFHEADRYVVYPVSGGSHAAVEVKLGRTSTESVEILSGVQPGMHVYLSAPGQTDKKPRDPA